MIQVDCPWAHLASCKCRVEKDGDSCAFVEVCIQRMWTFT